MNVPGGVGPGAWLGIAGSLLGAQPVTTSPTAPDDADDTVGPVRIIGYASIVGAALSFGFNLFWRVRYALQSAGGADFGKQNIAVIATAVVYGVVALVAVLVASRWLLRSTKASRLATIALGTSTLVAGILVWSLPVGRDIDAFHGIAQNTSTAGVGYEGYLAWAAAAAIFAPPTLLALPEHLVDRRRMPGGRRPEMACCSSPYGAWGQWLMRITDLVVAVSLNYPFSRYDSMVLAAFDLATAVLAIWLRINLGNDIGVHEADLVAVRTALPRLSISRVVVGVALAPRFQKPQRRRVAPTRSTETISPSRSPAPSTWRCAGWRWASLPAAIISGRISRCAPRSNARPTRRAADTRTAKPPSAVPPSAAVTTRIPTRPAGKRPPPCCRGRPGRPGSSAVTTPPPARSRSTDIQTQHLPAAARPDVKRITATVRRRIRAGPRADRRPRGNPAPVRRGRGRRRCGARRRCGIGR